MLSEIKFEHKTVSFSEINLLPTKVRNPTEVSYCCPPFHPESKTGILSHDSALLLLKLHPLVLWDKNYCVLGRRILHLVAPHIFSTDKIGVGFLPSATEDQVKMLMTVEPLLNQISFATQSGSKGIFETSRKTDKAIVNAVSPILNQSIDTISKMFADCSLSTLFKLNAKSDAKT